MQRSLNQEFHGLSRVECQRVIVQWLTPYAQLFSPNPIHGMPSGSTTTTSVLSGMLTGSLSERTTG